ncbi:MAG: uracil-DNA glycosylase, partial [Patescibacteria group bacterium]
LFIGEAPGFHEDVQKRPFVGQSGKLLDKMFAKIGLPRRDVYITNIVKRRPPENRDPTPEEIEAYKPYLAAQIALINPKVIATLGRFSMNYFLPLAKMTNDHGKSTTLDGRIIFPLYHPAAALRAGSAMRALETDFFALGKIVGITPPPPPTPLAATPSVVPPPPVPAEPEPEQAKLF